MKAIRKAIAAAGFAAAAALGTALLDGDVTTAELLASVGAGLIAGAGTWSIPNRPPPDVM